MENLTNLQQICMEVFNSVSSATTVFLLPLTLGRIVYSNSIGEGQKAFETIKGLAVYFIATVAYPYLLEILFSIPDAFLPKSQSFSQISDSASEINLLNVLPSSLDIISNVVLSALYWIVYYLHVFFMILMSSMAPVVFMLGSILGIGLGLEIFMGLLVIGSTWPIIWYGFDQVYIALVSRQDDSFGSKCLEILITLFKGLAPITFASLAMKSPAGQAIAGASKMALRASSGSVGLGAKLMTERSPSQKSVGFQLVGPENWPQWMHQELNVERTAKFKQQRSDRLDRARKDRRR